MSTVCVTVLFTVLCRVIINLLNMSRPIENNSLLLIMNNDIGQEGEAKTNRGKERARTRWRKSRMAGGWGCGWGETGGEDRENKILCTENCSLIDQELIG